MAYFGLCKFLKNLSVLCFGTNLLGHPLCMYFKHKHGLVRSCKLNTVSNLELDLLVDDNAVDDLLVEDDNADDDLPLHPRAPSRPLGTASTSRMKEACSAASMAQN